MKLAGIAVILLGWLIAVGGLSTGSVAIEGLAAIGGFGVSLFGIIGLLNPAHNANAIWKA
jgi:hypothetical protein